MPRMVTSSGRGSLVFSAQSVPAVPAMLWLASSSSVVHAKDGASGDNWNCPPVNATLAGNCLVLKISYTSGLTPSISDPVNGTWPAPAVVCDAGGGGLVMAVYVLPNAAAGVAIPTVVFGTNTYPFFYEYSEWSGVASASPVNGSSSQSFQSGSSLSCGSFTPTANNDANGGNLVLAWFDCADLQGSDSPASFVAGGSFTLLSADIAGGATQTYAHAMQSFVQTSRAAINPGVTATGNSGTHYNCAAIALKAGNAGQAQPAGVYVKKISVQTVGTPPASWTVQMPFSGNLRVLTVTAVTIENFTAVVDSDDGVPWTRIPSANHGTAVWYREGKSPSANCAVTISVTTPYPYTTSIKFYDLAGARNSGSLGTWSEFLDTDEFSVVTVNDAPSITPVSGDIGGQCVVVGANFTGPTWGFASGAPSNAIFDLPTYSNEIDSSFMANADNNAHCTVLSTATLHFNWTTAAAANNNVTGVAAIFR